MTGLLVSVLGPLEASVDGLEVEVGGAMPRRLLGLLASRAGTDVTADRLVEDLWQGSPPGGAAATLQSHVARLRRALGAPQALETRPGGYRLVADVDARTFELAVAAARAGDTADLAATLRPALTAWRGPAYDGLRDLAPLALEGSRLDDLRLTVTIACVDAEHAAGHIDGHVEELEHLARLHRVSEPLQARLVRALYAADRQADALAAYQEARAALREELGVEPGAALREVEHRVLTQDAGLLPGRPPAVADPAPERRRVTVLAAEVAGDDGGDPDVAAATSQRIALRTVVEHHGGRLLPSPGLTAFAVFGAPIAHDDDTARAFRAARGLVDDGVAVRAGLATGLVVAEADGAPRAGQVTQRAERLARAARGGEVRMDPATRGTALAEGATGVVAPFVGRAHDLAALRHAVDTALEQRTVQLATVVGEPGMGKSRLLAELLAGLTEADTDTRTAVCPAYGEAAGLQVVGRLLGEDAVRTDEVGSRYDAYEAWTARLRADAGGRPLVLVVDDLHWADDLVTGFLHHLLTGAANGAGGAAGPLVVVAAGRPELHRRHPTWGQGVAAATSLRLAPLSPAETAELVAGLGADAGVAEDSGGVPLHVVELARLGDRDPAEGGATLASVLQARLDTLGHEARATVVDAAVIGKRFPLGGLRAVRSASGASTAELRAAVTELVEREFLRWLPARQPETDARELVFTHDLVRSAAYDRLLRRDAAARHLSVAHWGERDESTDPTFQAHHALRAHDLADEAGDPDLAARARPMAQRYAQAAGQAVLGLDTATAERLLRRAVELAGPGVDRARAQCCLGECLFDAGRFAEAAPLLRAGLVGLEGVPDPMRVEACQWEMWNHFALGLDLGGPGGEMRRLVDELPESPVTVTALGALASLDLIRQTPDSLRAAVEGADRAIALARRLGHPESTGLARAVRGRARLGLGEADGLREMEEAQADLEKHEIGTFQIAYEIWRAGAEHHWAGPEAELATRRRLERRAEQRGLAYMTSFSVAEEVRCLAELGRFREAIALADTVDPASEAQPRWAVVQRALCLADLGELDARTVAVTAATPPASADDLRHVLGQVLVAGTADPANVPSLVSELGDLTPYAERDGAVELLPRLVRMARDAGRPDLVAGLPDVTGPSPLARAVGPHLAGLAAQEPALLARAADRWRDLGHPVEHALALLDLAEAGQGRGRRGRPGADARTALAGLGMTPWLERLQGSAG